MSSRPLGGVALVALGINGIVGVGIFVAPPAVAAAVPGARGALVYLAMAAFCLPVALTYARLARAMPEDGASALYAERAFGPKVAGGIGVLAWVSAIFSSAAVTRALADVVAEATHVAWLAPAFAIAATAFLAVVNLRGLRPSAHAWTVLTALKLAPLVVVAALGALAAPGAPAAALATAGGQAPLGPALLAVLFAMQGFEIVPLPAGQARDPERAIPRATVLSLALAGVLYAAIHLACARALPALASSTTPIPDAARALGGPALAHAVAAGVNASIAGIVVGMHAMTPRYLTAAVRPGARDAVDARAIVVTAMMVAALAATGALASLIALSSIAVLAQYAVTALALLAIAARRKVSMAPRDAWPTLPALAVVAALLTEARGLDLAIAAAVAVAGAIIVHALRRGRA